MQTDSASGTITLADTYTYGVSLHELTDHVDKWSKDHGHQQLLRRIRHGAGREVYVRVVSRVYLTGRVVVNMSNTRAFEAAGKAGVAPDVTLPAAQPPVGAPGTEAERAAAPTAIEHAARLVAVERARAAAVEEAVRAAAPGGAFKVVQASSRTVTMSETFGRPLVVGFLGFDFPVLENGKLGPPLSTRARLGGDKAPVRIGVLTVPQEEYLMLRQAVEGSNFKEAIYAATAKEIGGEFMTAYAAAKATDGATIAFTATKTGWLVGKSPQELYEREVYDALLKAWREAQ